MASTMQVDQITNAAGSGAPSFPNGISGVTVAARAANASAASSGTLTKVVFSTVTFDTNTGFNTPNPDTYTVPSTGDYLVSFVLTLSSYNPGAGGDSLQAAIYKNGVSFVTFDQGVPGGVSSAWGIARTDLVPCTAGDTLQLFFSQGTAAGTTFRGAQCSFTVAKQ